MKKIALTLVVILGLGMTFRAFVLPNLPNFDLAAVLPAVVAMLTNNERAAQNVAKLDVDPLLNKAAQAKADDMAKKGYFSHIGPDGTVPWNWIERAGYKYSYAGENLAVNFDDSGQVVKAWMNSPGHRLNILKPQYKDIGVGTAVGTFLGRSATFTVQMFASPVK